MRCKHPGVHGLDSGWSCAGLYMAGLLLLVLVCGALSASQAQQPQAAPYRFAIGDRSREVLSGTVWLYSYSWYGLKSTKLADIQDGVAEIPLDVERVRRELDPNPNTDAYVVVLQLPNHIWFRSADISPDSIWNDLTLALNGLGQTTTLPDGGTLLILPALDKRRITLLHEDGRPAVRVLVSVSIYLYDTNHCGSHVGLPLGNVVTDGTGTIEVTAPLVPLYLDSIIYYESNKTAPIGGSYELNMGLKLGSGHAVVIRKAWNFPDRPDLPEKEFEIRVLDSRGKPLPDVNVEETTRANTCWAANGSIGQTNSSGTAHVRLVPQIVSDLRLLRPNEEPRVLSAEELRQLFARGTFTVQWQHADK
jgi:hypothetical protein